MATSTQFGKYFIDAPSFLLYFIGFNLQTPPFDNPKVRQAIGMAIDKKKIIQLSSGTGVLASSLYHPAFPCNNKNAKDPLPYDPAAAKKLLADAGFPNGLQAKAWLRQSRAWIARVPESIQQDLAASQQREGELRAALTQQDSDGVSLADSVTSLRAENAALLVEIHGRGEYALIPFPPNRKSIDIGDYYADYRLIQGKLGWRPRVTLRWRGCSVRRCTSRVGSMRRIVRRFSRRASHASTAPPGASNSGRLGSAVNSRCTPLARISCCTSSIARSTVSFTLVKPR